MVITALLDIYHKSPLSPYKSPMCTLYQTVQVCVSPTYASVCHHIPFSIYFPNTTHTKAYFLGYFFLININDFLICFALSKHSDTQLHTTPPLQISTALPHLCRALITSQLCSYSVFILFILNKQEASWRLAQRLAQRVK